jgi:hypothetical protein
MVLNQIRSVIQSADKIEIAGTWPLNSDRAFIPIVLFNQGLEEK